MKKIVITIFLTLCLAVFLPSSWAHAYDFDSGGFNVKVNVDSPFGEGESAVNNSVSTIFNIVITVSQIAFILMFLIGGIMYLTSMGNDDATDKAKKLMLSAIIGVVIVLAAWGVGTWVLDLLKNNGQTNILNNTPTTTSETTGLPSTSTVPTSETTEIPIN